MARLWQQIRRGEQGQALPVVLVMLVLGGLLVAPALMLASTSLKAGQGVEENVRGFYAADAAVENVLWCLKNSVSPLPTQVNVNQMQVEIETDLVDSEGVVLAGGKIAPREVHYDWLAVDGEMAWDGGAGAYRYTITVFWQAPEPRDIHLAGIGVRLPVGYVYEPGSAASPDFDPNLSADEPTDTLDGAGAHMLAWGLGPPSPYISEGTVTQRFHFTGDGELEGDYVWVVSVPDDIVIVGNVTGMLNRITATATRPGDVETTARVVVDAMLLGTGEIRILLWQVNPQQVNPQ